MGIRSRFRKTLRIFSSVSPRLQGEFAFLLKLETRNLTLGWLPLPERKLIERIARQAQIARRPRVVRTGIGDDCAVLRAPGGSDLLLTTDFSLEGVHFRREWHPAAAVGHRCLARGLSDIAAMGGEPLALFLSLALPPSLPQRWADEFMRGLLALARRFRVPLAGGDLAESPSPSRKGGGPVLADVVVLGSVPTGKALLRSGARVGDQIYVTGTLGGAAAVLTQLYRGRKPKPRAAAPYLYPMPRLAVARALRQRGLATAMIDISDGLSTDLSHLCQQSGVGAELQAQAIPRARLDGQPVDLKFALHGGDDYELLFTAPAAAPVPSRIAGVSITAIGRIVAQRRMLLVSATGKRPLQARGWQHFRNA